MFRKDWGCNTGYTLFFPFVPFFNPLACLVFLSKRHTALSEGFKTTVRRRRTVELSLPSKMFLLELFFFEFNKTVVNTPEFRFVIASPTFSVK